MLSLNILEALCAAFALGIPHAAAQTSTDPCAAVATEQAKAFTNIPKDGDLVLSALFDADTAYKCALSVPFNKDHALQMLDLALQYAGFQTTLAYLKNPPQSYLQAPVDVMDRFNQIRQKINGNKYPTLYDFDLDMLALVRDTHEGHFSLPTGVLNLFKWSLPDTLVSFSKDGKEIPQVYSAKDVFRNVSDPSPVVQLGGKSVFEYLRSYASNTSDLGLVEPHAEWNVIMQNSAYSFGASGSDDYQSYYPGYFESTPVYNGPSITGSFANGTRFEWKYQAGSNQLLGQGNLTSGQDIYDNYVMNPDFGSNRKRATGPFDPRKLPGSPVIKRDTPAVSATAVPLPNYPKNPIVIQANFSSGGIVSGYILESDSIGVLSIPSFNAQDGKADPLSFHDAVAGFISQASSKGMKKVVIDLSGNGGGNVNLGYDTFKQFFPSGQPGSAVRARVTPQVNTYGSIVTGIARDNGTFFDSDVKASFAAVTLGAGQVNADYTLNQNRSAWKSWGSFCTPQAIHGDNFTKLATYNLTDPRTTADLGFQMANTNISQGAPAAPWAANDIIILLDGYCASTCNIFVDLMKNDAGVKTVAVGGVPQNSPMQGVAGTRGASVVPWYRYTGLSEAIGSLILDDPNDSAKAFTAFGLNASDLNGLPPRTDQAPWNVREAGINALDMIRFDSPQEPRQFAYEAANCRLFYTRDMIRDVSQVWRAAVQVAGGDNSQCVEGSVDAQGSGVNQTVTTSVGFTAADIWNSANSTNVTQNSSNGSNSDSSGSDYGVGMASLVVLLSLMVTFLS
ncbi:unnamed protein product [Clonostachys chloroleuca]|uniref:Tail specific protease domain-containing protein n=1 Tax=Clonostachys chloroleuca TaxID=1926264 RepID=A0AA35LRM1_9HYPO|nr:unnamed protein product [Clonostachys chloroleuca]